MSDEDAQDSLPEQDYSDVDFYIDDDTEPPDDDDDPETQDFAAADHPRGESGPGTTPGSFKKGGGGSKGVMRKTPKRRLDGLHVSSKEGHGTGLITAELDDEKVGSLRYDVRPGGKALLYSVDVDENHTRKGIAREMYVQLRKELEQAGVKTLSGSLEGSGPVQLREEVFGAGNTKYFHGSDEVSVEKAIKIMDKDYGYLRAVTTLKSTTEDARFVESEHPRADDGKFGDKGSGGKATPAPPRSAAPKAKMTEAQSRKNIQYLEQHGKEVPFTSEAVMERVAAKDKGRGFDWDKDCHRYTVEAPKDRAQWPAHCLRIPPDAKGPIYLGVYPESAFWGSYMPSNGGPRKSLYHPAYRVQGNSRKLERHKQLAKDEATIDAKLKAACKNGKCDSDVAFMYASAMWALAIRSGDENAGNKILDRKTGTITETGPTFGARGILGKHVRVRKDGVFISMPGKKGSEIDLRVPDEFAKRYVTLKEKAGSNGKIFGDISHAALRDWMSTVKLEGTRTLKDYIPHDVRMLRATQEARRQINSMKLPLNAKQWAESFKKVKAAAGKVLTDTPNAAMPYIDPAVWSKWSRWEDKKVMDKVRKFWGEAEDE
jgi:hypothetical protein